MALGLINPATLRSEDHEIFVVGGDDAFGAMGGGDIAGDNIVRFFVLNREGGPTESDGDFAEERKLFFESLGSFFAVGFIFGVGG